MTHDEACQLVDAYVDGELDMVSTLAFDQHAAACADCAAKLQSRTQLVKSVRAAGLSYKAPELLRGRVERDLRTHAGPARSLSTARWLPAALAAGMVLAIGGFYVGEDRAHSGIAAAQFASAHNRALLVGHEVDVLSSDHHVVKPWFAGRLDFSPPLRNSPAAAISWWEAALISSRTGVSLRWCTGMERTWRPCSSGRATVRRQAQSAKGASMASACYGAPSATWTVSS